MCVCIFLPLLLAIFCSKHLENSLCLANNWFTKFAFRSGVTTKKKRISFIFWNHLKMVGKLNLFFFEMAHVILGLNIERKKNDCVLLWLKTTESGQTKLSVYINTRIVWEFKKNRMLGKSDLWLNWISAVAKIYSLFYIENELNSETQ